MAGSSGDSSGTLHESEWDLVQMQAQASDTSRAEFAEVQAVMGMQERALAPVQALERSDMRMLQDSCGTPVQLTFDFLRGITNDFSEENVLGCGGFGVVYKGVLQNGKAIAVKRLKIFETNLDDVQYQKELRNLSGLKHRNIVQLKGYCDDSWQVPCKIQSLGRDKCVVAEKRERILCFEYVCNKSLREHISDTSCGLEWSVRFEIIKGICSGLHYLHMERDIAHMDLKPENILLDDNMVPKIADFGTSRLFVENNSRIITKNCVGSRGYIAPEYFDGMISKKADIFSFGVIILELVTGSKFDYPQSAEDVVEKWKDRLPNAGYRQQVRTCISIALNCVEVNRDKRPTTGCIMKKLNEVQDPSGSWSRMQNTRKQIAIEVGAVVLILSLILTTMNMVTAAVSLFAMGVVAIRLVSYLKNHCSSRSWMMLFTVGAVLAAVLILLNPGSILFTIGSSAANTLKYVIMAGVTLFAIAIVVLLVLGHRQYAGLLIFVVVAVLFAPFLPAKQEGKNEATKKSGTTSNNGA